MKKDIVQNRKLVTTVTTVISVLLIIAGTIGLILIQKPLRESQDLRKAASVDAGQVTVTSSPASGAELTAGEVTTINLQANTSGVQTDGVQLVFNLLGQFSDTPTAVVPSASGLHSAYTQVERTADGYLISVAALPQQVGATFASTTPTTVVELSFTPAAAGNIQLNFDRELSKSIIHGSQNAEDALTHVAVIHYTVADSSSAPLSGYCQSCGERVSANTPVSHQCETGLVCARISNGIHDCLSCPGVCVQPGENSTVCDQSSTSPSPSPTPSPTPSPSPTDEPGTGGLTIKSCNESCSSNAECETNHRCYNGKCRLVTNVSSETCAEYNPGDQGLHFGCNEYCADSNECDSQYKCLENRCRREDNPDDKFCRIPSSTIQKNIAASCNTACQTNADCAMNLRCYYGACRLATNVSSTTCSATSTKTVSNLYTKKTLPKGGDLSDQSDTKLNGNTTVDASASPAVVIDYASPTPKTNPADNMPKKETALDALLSSLRKMGVPANLLPILALGLGGLLLLLLIIPKLFSNSKKNKHQTHTREMNGPGSSKYEAELKAKLAQIKKSAQPSAVPPTHPTSVRPQPTQSPATKPPVVRPQPKTPVASQQSARPPVVRPQPTQSPATRPPVVRPQSKPQPVGPQPIKPKTAGVAKTDRMTETAGVAKTAGVSKTAGVVKPASTTTSSMMERIKNKGIQQPGQNTKK